MSSWKLLFVFCFIHLYFMDGHVEAGTWPNTVVPLHYSFLD